jgi:hypothetical protein
LTDGESKNDFLEDENAAPLVPDSFKLTNGVVTPSWIDARFGDTAISNFCAVTGFGAKGTLSLAVVDEAPLDMDLEP